MRICSLSSLVATALFVITGCSASASSSRISTTPASQVGVAVADTSDAMWHPQEEMSLSFDETPARSTNARSSNVASAMPTPNQRELVRGALHAATY